MGDTVERCNDLDLDTTANGELIVILVGQRSLQLNATELQS